MVGVRGTGVMIDGTGVYAIQSQNPNEAISIENKNNTTTTTLKPCQHYSNGQIRDLQTWPSTTYCAYSALVREHILKDVAYLNTLESEAAKKERAITAPLKVWESEVCGDTTKEFSPNAAQCVDKNTIAVAVYKDGELKLYANDVEKDVGKIDQNSNNQEKYRWKFKIKASELIFWREGIKITLQQSHISEKNWLSAQIFNPGSRISTFSLPVDSSKSREAIFINWSEDLYFIDPDFDPEENIIQIIWYK